MIEHISPYIQVIIGSAKKTLKISLGKMSFADFKRAEFQTTRVSLLIPFTLSIPEKTGRRTADIEPNIIPTNGSSMNPFENSAKVSLPKYLLIKSWVADDMITPHKDAYKSGSANLNISLYVNELF